jgi:hypothetical protein
MVFHDYYFEVLLIGREREIIDYWAVSPNPFYVVETLVSFCSASQDDKYKLYFVI